MRKYRDIELVTTEGRKNYLVSEPNYHPKNFFKKFISHENEKNIYILDLTSLLRSVNTIN